MAAVKTSDGIRNFFISCKLHILTDVREIWKLHTLRIFKTKFLYERKRKRQCMRTRRAAQVVL